MYRIIGLLLFLASVCWSPLSPAAAPTKSQPILRLEGPIHAPRLSPRRPLLAFTDLNGRSLRILDLTNHEVVEVTPQQVGPSYFWSPDGVRLLYREHIRKGKEVESQIHAYDAQLNRSARLDTLPGTSGYLSFDPRRSVLLLVHNTGILQRHLNFPGNRPATWQKTKPKQDGQWIATQAAVLWLTDLGLSLVKMPDDQSGVQSFAVSPDGLRIAWSTQKGKLYVAQAGASKPQFIGEGRDPSWHPFKTLLVYAAARRVGSRVYDHDLRIDDLQGGARFLQTTPDLEERWPLWIDATQLIYTANGVTDLFRLDLSPPAPLASSENPTPRKVPQ